MRSLVKHLAEQALLVSMIDRFSRRRHRGRRLILAYHNIVPAGATGRGDTSLHLDQARFGDQLDLLARFGEVVPLDAIDSAGRESELTFAVTFDDAYDGALTLGVEELRRRGMPATIFVAPALLGRTTWWDVLSDPVTGALPDHVRVDALTRLGGAGDRILAGRASGADMDRDDTRLPRIATIDRVRTALEYPGLTLGSHTWSHVNVTAVDEPELVTELTMPLEWLRSEFPSRHIPWLAYPYGISDARTQGAAAEAGYEGAVRVTGGWLDPAARDRFALSRYNVPRGLSPAGFRLRLSGIGG